MGYATGHPTLEGYRRHIATSRVLRLRGNRAETVNTLYTLRHPVHDVVFRGAEPLRVSIGDLVVEREGKGLWRLRRGPRRLLTNLPGRHAAMLAALAELDRPVDPSDHLALT